MILGRHAGPWMGRWILGVLLIVLTACVGEDDVVNPHEKGEKKGFESPHVQAQVDTPEWTVLRDQAERGEVSWETVAQSLAPDLLQNQKILDGLERPRASTQAQHRLFHQALLQIESSNRPLYQSLVRQYLDLLTPHCLESLNSCRVAQLWDDDQLVAELFARISMDEEAGLEPDERMRLVLLASDLALIPYPQIVRIAMLERAEYVRDEMVAQYAELNPEERLLLTQWTEEQQRSLRYFRGRDWAYPILRRQLEIWGWTDLFVLKSHPVMTDRNLIFELADETGLLEEYFKVFDSEMWNESGNLYELTVELQKKHPSLIRNLELKGPQLIVNHRVLFLLDLFFRERIQESEAEILLAGLDVSTTELSEGIHTYIQTYFAHMIARTSEYMRAQLNEYEPSNIIFFREVIRQSLEIEAAWLQFVQRSERFYSLIKAYAVTGLNDDGRAAVARVDTQVTDLRENIRLMAVFPNMLMFTYFIARAEFKHTFSFFGWVFSIQSSDILRTLMDGASTPYFTFGTNDRSPISYIQVLYAFYFALKTDTFANFGISVDDFFKLFTEQYLLNDRVQFLDGFRLLKQVESKDRYLFESYLNACRYLAERECDGTGEKPHVCGNKELFERPAVSALPRVVVTRPEDLRYRVGYGMPGFEWSGQDLAEPSTGPILSSALKIYRLPNQDFFPRRTLGELVELVRDDYSRRVRELHLFKELYLQHLREIGSSETDVQDAKERIEELLRPYDDEIREFYTWIVQRENQIGDCNQVLIRHENRLIQKVFDLERRHLERVHDMMSQARRNPGQLSEWNNRLLEGSQTHRALAENVEYADFALLKPKVDSEDRLQVNPAAIGFDLDYYTYSAYEFFARYKMYLEEGYPALDVKPIASFVEFQWPQQFKSFPKFLAPMMRIPYSEDKSEFVTTGLSHAFGHPRFAFVKWTSPYMQAGYALNRLQFLASIYKAGQIPVEAEGIPGLTEPCDDFLTPGSCWKMRAGDVVDSYLEDYENIRIDSEWERILASTGMDAKWSSIASLDEVAYQVEVVNYRFELQGFNGVFDHFYELTEKHFLSPGFILGQTTPYNEIPTNPNGQVAIPMNSIRYRLPGQIGALQYYNNCRSMKSLTFDGLSDIEHLLTPYFKGPAMTDWEARQKLVEAVEDRWQSDQESNSVVEFYHSLTEGPSLRPYLKSGFSRNFYSQKRKYFEEQTGGFYLNPEARCHQ